jgi:putative nucleotidyltransferase with HDIG domain
MRRYQVGAVETAALLHDIGKIDEIFATILSKPGRLTADEREVIASHATRGAEFLTSISSFRPDIILAVRHHHERIDGKGYPDNMVGDEIPIGARIIKVCDAVDAMLSNRPYRNALPLPAVRQQLVEYAGVQFDLKVVQAVISTGMLEEHQSDLAATQEVGGKDIRWGATRPRSRQVGAGQRTPLAT